MKLSANLIIGFVFFILGLAGIIIGAYFKLNHYGEGWITGNNIIILGMLLELVGMFVVGASLLKKYK